MAYILHDLKIEVTHKCPLACAHCSSESLPSNLLQMDISTAKGIIENAKLLGIHQVSISGGEPFSWPELIPFVEYINEQEIGTVIYTSGNIDTFSDIIAKLSQFNIKKFVFSLYSDNQIEHERVTRKLGSFKKTINAIQETQKYGIDVEIHFVAMRTNYKSLMGLAKLAIDLGIATISILRFVPQGRGRFLYSGALSVSQYKELKKVIEILRDKIKIRTGSPFNFLFINENPRCLSGIDKLIIGPDLNIYPCDAMKHFTPDDFQITDSYFNLKNKTLSECWEKSELLKLVRYASTDFGEICSKCNMLDYCQSGCLAQKFIYNGVTSKIPDPFCLLGNGSESK